jgi:predicted phage tail protein
MSTTRFTTSTAIAYVLLGEGPMRLKNGLNSVFLNRTPLSNASVAAATLSRDAVVYVGPAGNTLLLGFGTVGIPGSFPILLKGAGKLAVGSINAGSGTLNMNSSFFTPDMLASDSAGDGGLYQKIRVPGAGPAGSELEAEIVQIISPTQALLNRGASNTVSNVNVTWDHYAIGRETTTTGNNTISISPAVPRTDLRTNVATAQSIWPRVLATIGNGSTGFGTDAVPMNFKNVRVNFRPGTLDQEPVQNSLGFTSASSGVSLNTPINQIDSITNGASTIQVWTAAPRIWWSNREVVENLLPNTPATSPVTIISGAGSNGLNVGNPAEVDEIALAIAFPNGLYAYTGEKDRYDSTGVVFQIYFDYKVASASAFQSKLIYGPTPAEVATRTTAFLSYSGGDLAQGWTTSGSVKAQNTSSFNQEFRFSVDEFKPFDEFRIRIIKLTPDGYKVNGWQVVNDTALSYVQAFINDRLSYPLSAYLALEFNSQEFQGRFPDIAAHCYGIECDVPTNYVTREEAEDGIAKYTRNSSGVITTTYVPWNGSFRRAYTNNPIWVIRELLLNRRFGLGTWLNRTQINNYALYSLARYADDLVPDGNGGLEPRFTCGAYLTQSTEAYKVIKDFFTCVLAIPYWVGGQLMAIGDRPGEPVYTFTKGNIEGGIFNYEGTGTKVRTNQVAVTFNDKDSFYEQRVEIVDDIDDIITNNRVITEEVVAFGATSRGQATRYGRWKMLTAKLQKDIVSFKTGENAIFLKPGDIVSIQDADKNRVRFSGRIVSGNINSITLDKPITLVAGETYEIHAVIPGPATYLGQDSAVIDSVTYAKGDQVPIFTEEEANNLVDDDGNEVAVYFTEFQHLETRSVTNSAGANQSTINVNANFSSIPESDFIWAITAKDSSGALIPGAPKQYRILSIAEDKGGYGIVATEHFNYKFDLINEDYILEPVREAPSYADMPPPRELTAGVQSINSGSDNNISNTSAKILLSWKIPVKIIAGIEQPVNNLDSYILKYTTPEGNLMQLSLSSNTTSYTINNPTLGVYSFSLQSKSDAGPVSRPAVADLVVQLDTVTPGLAVQLKLLRGGEFTRPPIIASGTVDMPEDYDYTSPLGTKTRVRDGILS